MPSLPSLPAVERALTSHPLPIADAAAALLAAEGLHERRDRIVECFRAHLRLVAAVALAVRLQRGPGPGGDDAEVRELLQGLRRRSLTDGQWVGLTRTLLKPYARQPGLHPLPLLVELFHGAAAREVHPLVDGLLAMRKAETVAHGATGDQAELTAILERRQPQLEALLTRFDALWDEARLVLPLPSTQGEPQRAWLLMGDTPSRGRFRRMELRAGMELPPGEPVLVDREGAPRVALTLVVRVQRPSPEAVEELFVLDGAHRREARYLALPSMAEHRVPNVWGQLEQSLGSEQEAPSSEQQAAGASRPFRGLESFGPEHASLYFGREAQAQALANRIRQHPWVTVTGPSGSGKSSLLHAGVQPRLTDFRVLTLRPGPAPLATLSTRLLTALEDPAQAEQLAEVARANPGELGIALARACLASGSRLLLLVDQAEELLTLCTDSAQREAFARALASAAADASGPVRVVLSLREDFFGRMATLAPLRGLYTRQVEVVTAIEKEGLVEALVQPLERFGFTFEDAALVNAMVEPLVGEAAALPVLQFCADQLWEARDRVWKRLTWEAYRALGGIEGALATHAERTLQQMTGSQQHVARALLIRLVTSEGTRAVVSHGELVRGEEEQAVLDRLVAARLVSMRDAPEQGPDVELVHEALLRHWERLREWLEDGKQLRRVLHRASAAARTWQQEQRPRELLHSEGALLSDAQALLAAPDLSLSETEHAFLLASVEQGRTRRVLRQLTVGTIGFLGLFLLTDKLMQYAGLSQLAGDTLKVVMGIVLVPLTWLLLRRTRAERLSPRPAPHR